MNTRLIGDAGERAALRALRRKGYRLVCRNFTALGCEIDLIMRDRDTLVFVEVKTRSSHEYGYGREAVGHQKQQRLIVAAKAFMKQKAVADLPARFDVVEVDAVTKSAQHIVGAFLSD